MSQVVYPIPKSELKQFVTTPHNGRVDNEIFGDKAEGLYNYFLNLGSSETQPQQSPLPVNQQWITYPHDGLIFRSKTEIKIYEVLREHNILFFVNATAVLAGKALKREPDFLICQNGKWGILEVMGEQAHPSSTAPRDHDRGRLFEDYGIRCIQFYDAARCYKQPDEVVADFLKRLAQY